MNAHAPVDAGYCAYCGLPLAAPMGDAGSAESADFCCSGCRVAAAVADAPAHEGAVRGLVLRIGLAIFFTMNVVVFTMELWSQDVYADRSYESTFAVHLRGVFQWASLLFAAPVLLLLAGPIAAGVRQSLRRRAATTDLLILLGVFASYAYSVISVLRGQGQIYFEVGCVVLVFVSIGRWLEARGKHQTGAALDALARLLPTTVRRAVVTNATINDLREWESVPREEIRVNDLVRVLPGERLPVDGSIVRGRATLDEQIVTGESRPASKSVGDLAYSGVLNVDGDLWIRVTAAAGDDLVSRLLGLVRDARRQKGPHERLADRVAAWFTPLVCAVAVGAGLWHGTTAGLDRGILVGLSVVLIACPCALGLATPMAVWTALGRAADEQVLFRSGAVLERLARVEAICFDKTGTLTLGVAEVRDVLIAPEASHAAVLAVASYLGSGSQHPLSQAIVAFARGFRQWHQRHGVDAAVDFPEDDAAALDGFVEVQTHAGRGVAGVNSAGDRVAFLGSARWMEELGCELPAGLAHALAANDGSESPLACVAWHGVVQGVFVFREQLRAEAARTVEACKSLGLATWLVTGDRGARAAAIGRELGMDVLAEQLPEEKVTALQQAGRRAAMVGDGINDAPALAAAHVGVALGCGADLSRDAAGVCLLGNQLDRLPWAVALSRRTLKVVRQNLFWAFAYNIAGVVLAAAGRLNPIWAAAAMGASSIMVIGNSLRLAKFEAPPFKMPGESRTVTRNEWDAAEASPGWERQHAAQREQPPLAALAGGGR